MSRSQSSRIATAALLAAILSTSPYAAIAANILNINDPASFLTINGDLNLDVTTPGGYGALLLTAGNLTVTGNTTLVNGNTVNGVTTGITLAGGTLNTGVLNLNGLANNFIWTSGTLDLTNSALMIGSNINSGNTIGPNNETLNSNQSLILSGVGESLSIGVAAAGNLDLNGASLTTSSNVFVANSNVSGLLTFENDSIANIGGGLKVGVSNQSNANGTVNILTGASVSAVFLDITDGSNFSAQTGSVTINNASLDITSSAFIGGNTTTNANANLSILSNATLTIGGNCIASSNSHLFLSGGNFAASNITLTGNGTFNFFSGALNANNITIQSTATFTQTSGTLTANAINQTGGTVNIGFAHSTTTLSQGREFLSATSVGTKAIFAGGLNGLLSLGEYSSVVDIYDSTTNKWSTANLSQSRELLAATTVGSKALFAGGYGNGTDSSVVDIYDNTTNQWSTANLSLARSQIAAVTVGNLALFAGGVIDTTSPNVGFNGLPGRNSPDTNVVDIYNSTTNLWSTTTIPIAGYDFAAASAGTKALFEIGAHRNVIEIYDTATNLWSFHTISHFPEFAAATSVGTKALFAGGADSSPAITDNIVDIYDSSTNQWTTSTLPFSDYAITATTVGSYAIFAGGAGSNNAVAIYDNNNNLWLTSTLNKGSQFSAATSIGSQAFVAGGYSTGITNAVDIFNLGNATLSLGTGTSNINAYTLSNGSLTATYINMLPGGSFTQSGGTLTAPNFTQSGGNTTFTTTAPLLLSSSTVSNYTLSGGSLTTPTLTLSPGGQFHFDAGSFSAPITGATSSNLFLAPSSNSFSPSTPLATIPVPSNSSYANIGSSADADLHSAASLLFGTNSTGSDSALTMRWRTQSSSEGFIKSDILDLSGMVNSGNPTGQSDLFVIQISYDPTGLTLAQEQALFLGSSSTGTWDNAIAGNFGPNTGTYFLGPWINDPAHDALGSWGIDTTNNIVWAVVDHNTEFAAVPEPTTLSLLALSIPLLLRRRRCNDVAPRRAV